MTTKEVATRFHVLAQEGKWHQILDELYSEDATSSEPPGAQGLPNVSGLDKIREKGKAWENMVEAVHDGYCGEPQVAGDFFTLVMGTDITMKGQPRQSMDEVAVYKVKGGKIVSEQFFY